VIALGISKFPLQYKHSNWYRNINTGFTEGPIWILKYLFRKEAKPQFTKGRQPFYSISLLYNIITINDKRQPKPSEIYIKEGS